MLWFKYGSAVAKVRVEFNESELTRLVNENKYIRDALVGTARLVAAEAEATAQDAQNGPGGTLSGYAEAGFTVIWEARGGKRPRVLIQSNADPQMALRVHFYTQKRDGISHLRAALKTVSR